jgi:hypothetical protein
MFCFVKAILSQVYGFLLRIDLFYLQRQAMSLLFLYGNTYPRIKYGAGSNLHKDTRAYSKRNRREAQQRASHFVLMAFRHYGVSERNAEGNETEMHLKMHANFLAAS